MHLLARQSSSLDDEAEAMPPTQAPGDLVLLSFSDADLGSLAAAWQGMAEPRPSLVLENLSRLRHPMSVDLFVEKLVAPARCVIIRLLGGIEAWRYGVEEVAAACRAGGIPLVLLPGDGGGDAALAALSSVAAAPRARLAACFRAGGMAQARLALALAAELAGLAAAPLPQAEILPQAGWHALPAPPPTGAFATAIILFYRSHLLAGDIAPVSALAAALAARDMACQAIYVSSLKDPAATSFVRQALAATRPQVVLNLTGFAARTPTDGSPLEQAGVPILQLVLAGVTRAAWAASARGLHAADLAMQVVLPENDGRLLASAIAFKQAAAPIPELVFAPVLHRPDAAGIALAADRAAGWARLATTPRAHKRIALVLSDYPGAIRGHSGQIGHAVGLDSLASLDAICGQLRAAGYALGNAETASSAALVQAEPQPIVSLAAYRGWFSTLPATVQDAVNAAWGDAAQDGQLRHGAFHLRVLQPGNLLVAVQPDRAAPGLDRKTAFHDPVLPPCHAYLAFYLWLRHEIGVHALLHLGAHGTLEWLPGKAVALSENCFPALLAGGMPVIYPFIVNNPGEAAAAKRRLGALTIGHLTPPLCLAGLHGGAAALELLLEEYAAADGLDRRRARLLAPQILAQAAADNLLAEAGATPDLAPDDALARLDAYLCDIKEMQISDGLHVFGVPPPPAQRLALLAQLQAASPDLLHDIGTRRLDACAEAEAAALLAALDGHFVAPGPGGAPSTGRADVLPTGRNIFGNDPRAIPTRAAMQLATREAALLLARHRQDHGTWPRNLVVDVWGSATLRSGGGALALALVLIGAMPVWDTASGRMTGIEILPIAQLAQPRIDVTLRMSGLFRDMFEDQVALFDAAIRAIAARDEAAEWNPLAAACAGLAGDARRQASARIFGPAFGAYGSGVAPGLASGADGAALGAAYLAGSAAAYGQNLGGAANAPGFAARVAGADGFVHAQDHAESDILQTADPAAHIGGFAAAAMLLGNAPALYLADASGRTPRCRSIGQEIARLVRGRAANPLWIAGMMRHGYRGAAEMSRTLDALHGFAATLPDRLDAQFDQYYAATLGNPDVAAFLRQANPAAHAAMQARFADAQARGLWRSRRNDIGFAERAG